VKQSFRVYVLKLSSGFLNLGSVPTRTGASLDGKAISLLECIPLPESSIALSEAQALPEPRTGSVKSDSRMLPAEGLPTFPVSRKPKRKNMRPTFRTDLRRPTRSCFMGCIGDEDGELVPARATRLEVEGSRVRI